MSIDPNAFKTLGIEACYYLGLFIADGCVGNYSGKPCISLGLHTKDLYMVKQFKHFLKSDYAITKYKNLEHYKFRGYSKEVAETLLTYGIGPRKSHTFDGTKIFHKLSDKQFMHVLRGIIDGDGHIDSHPERARIILGCANKVALEHILARLKVIIPELKASLHTRKQGIHILAINRLSCLKLIPLLYKNAKGLCLIRKFNSALEILKQGEPPRGGRSHKQYGLDFTEETKTRTK